MGNGAAGCGWEYRDMPNNWECGFLQVKSQLFGEEFFCGKFNQDLKKQRTTGHPFRCPQCSDASFKYHESIAAAQRQEELNKKSTNN